MAAASSMFECGPECRVFGGVALSALFASTAAAAFRRKPLGEAIASGLASALTGVVVGFLCMAAWGSDQPYLTYAVVSLGSWMGAPLLDKLSATAWAVASSKIPKAPPPAQE